MKTAKTLSYHDLNSIEQSHQIKCYLKLYNPNGLSSPEAHPPANFEILDENTLLRKTIVQNKQQYQMYPYTRIFSARIGNQLMSRHVCFADDLQEGINHTTIATVDHPTKRLFTTGSNQQHSVFVEYFMTTFQDFQNPHYQTKTSQLYLTMFATVNCKANQYIDLINGQRYTYLSKKDVDTASYKTFHELKVHSIQQFLIGLKIAMVRYQECCNDGDFVVFRLTAVNEDEFTDKKTTAVGNVVVCHQDNKNTETFLKQVQTLINYSSPTGQPYQVKDHGTLFSCIEPYLRNGKISIIQCILNEYEHIEANLPQIKRIPQLFMNKTNTYKINKQSIPLDKFLQNYEQIIKSQMNVHKNDLSTVNTLTTKELDKFTQIFASYKQFIKESTEKLLQFCKLYKQVIETRNEFYEKERFPVSLEIKQFEDVNFIIKSYYISKIYSLSEKFQMPSLQGPSEKMTTIKHQIFLSLKSLVSMLVKKNAKKQTETGQSEQNNHSSSSLNNASSFSLNKSYDYVTSPNKKARSDSIQNPNQKSSQKYEKLTKVMRAQLQTIKKNIKYILNIDSKSLMYEVKDDKNLNGQENKEKRKMTKLKQSKEMRFVLDNVDFGQLFGQELIVELEKLMKNLLSKRELSNVQRNNNRESIDLLVGPYHNNRQSDYIKDSALNSLHLSKKNSLTKDSHHESSQHQNSRMIIFREKKNKNISYHEKQANPQYPQKNTQRKMRKLISEPQTLEQSLLMVKKQQLSKHLQIRQEIKKFQNQSKLINRTHVSITQKPSEVLVKESDQIMNKSRIQSQKENLNTHITQVEDNGRYKEYVRENNKDKYQLVHQKSLNKANNDREMMKGRLHVNISQIFPQNMNPGNDTSTSKPIIKKKTKNHDQNKQNTITRHQQKNTSVISIQQSDKFTKNHSSNVLRLHKPQKSSITVNLPQLKRSLQKSLDINPDYRQTIIHSPKHKRKHMMTRIINNSIIDEGHQENHKRRFDSEGKKSFLPEISLLGKKISG